MAGEAGWEPDPSGRHQERWFDGANWSAQVRDHGIVNSDDQSGLAGSSASTSATTGSIPAARRRSTAGGPSPFGKIEAVAPTGPPAATVGGSTAGQAFPSAPGSATAPPFAMPSVPVVERIPAGSTPTAPPARAASRPAPSRSRPAPVEGQPGVAALAKNTIVSGLLAGALGGGLGMIAAEVLKNPDRITASSAVGLDVQTGIWTAIIGAVLGACLAAWSSITSSAWGRAGRVAAIGAAAGAVAGFIGGFVAQWIFFKLLDDLSYSAGESALKQRLLLARAIGWGIFGGVLGLGLGIPSGARKTASGLVGGFVGGAVGGLAFQQLGFIEDVKSVFVLRLVGLVITGIGIGVGIGVADRITRQAWIVFSSGPLRGCEVDLFKDRTTIGGASTCDVVLANDPTVSPLHVTLVTLAGGVVLEPAGSVSVGGEPITAPRNIRPGEAVQVGRSQFTTFERTAR